MDKDHNTWVIYFSQFRGWPRIKAWEGKFHPLDFQRSLFVFSDLVLWCEKARRGENPGIFLEWFNSFLASQLNKKQCPKIYLYIKNETWKGKLYCWRVHLASDSTLQVDLSVLSAGVNSVIQTNHPVCKLPKPLLLPFWPFHCSLAPLVKISRGEKKVRKLKPVHFSPC